ncbi:hypothetical protein J2T57_001668 [Natronocella acetinitrilica]|uniref:Uncharacterized protein n=1 Tax=Natronocella acetinitrilica TaxID=414046 RepID=A0AAE3G2G8_9GAMM|nr:hypothetical protein [Natronocella acetinitrilica]MCP1674566.1 hypothetical protein [Natronocella acetinitrilica]
MAQEGWFLIRGSSLAVGFPGRSVPTTIPASHPSYSEILLALEVEDYARVEQLVDPVRSLSVEFGEGSRVVIREGQLYFDGARVNSRLTKAIMRMVLRGESVAKFVRLLENIMENPDSRAIGELYGFIEANQLPVTADGQVLAYKVTRSDGYDLHSGTVHYPLGAVVEMPRDEVDPDPERTCSRGLHACSMRYLADSGFGGQQARCVLVKIHPRDFVAVPRDYNESKARVCRMQVVGEFIEGERGELARFDERIRKSLEAFGESVRLMGDADMREFLGFERKAGLDFSHLPGVGAEVMFAREGRARRGLVCGHVAPDESIAGALRRCRQSVASAVADAAEALGIDPEDDYVAYAADPVDGRERSVKSRLLVLDRVCRHGDAFDGEEQAGLIPLDEDSDDPDAFLGCPWYQGVVHVVDAEMVDVLDD